MISTIICRSCGANNRSNKSHCSRCNEPISVVSSQGEMLYINTKGTQIHICKNCGNASSKDTAKYCSSCGKKLPTVVKQIKTLLYIEVKSIEDEMERLKSLLQKGDSIINKDNLAKLREIESSLVKLRIEMNKVADISNFNNESLLFTLFSKGISKYIQSGEFKKDSNSPSQVIQIIVKSALWSIIEAEAHVLPESWQSNLARMTSPEIYAIVASHRRFLEESLKPPPFTKRKNDERMRKIKLLVQQRLINDLHNPKCYSGMIMLIRGLSDANKGFPILKDTLLEDEVTKAFPHTSNMIDFLSQILQTLSGAVAVDLVVDGIKTVLSDDATKIYDTLHNIISSTPEYSIVFGSDTGIGLDGGDGGGDGGGE